VQAAGGCPCADACAKVGLCRQQAGARNKADTGAHAGREHVCPCMEEGRCFVQIEHDCCVHNMKSCELLPDPHLPPASRYLCVITRTRYFLNHTCSDCPLCSHHICLISCVCHIPCACCVRHCPPRPPLSAASAMSVSVRRAPSGSAGLRQMSAGSATAGRVRQHPPAPADIRRRLQHMCANFPKQPFRVQ